MSHELQERYSKLVLAKLRKALKLKDGIVFNNDYMGDPKAGAVKIVQRDGEVSVADYDTVNGMSLTSSSTAYVTLNINKDKAVNEIIDGYEASAVPDNLYADRLDSAAYSLAKQIDTDGAAELVGNGTAVNIATLTTSNIYATVVDQRTALSKANIEFDNRYLLVTPDTLALILKCEEFIKASDLGDAVVQSGAVGRIAGFTVYEWNDTTANLAMIAGHPRYATRVREWSHPIRLVDLDGDSLYVGASAIKGRMVYAHKVLRNVGVRAVFVPTTIALTATALTGSDAGKYTIVASATDSGTLKYKVITDGVLTPYGTADTGFTSFTSGTTKITAASGNVIEIGEFNGDSKLIASGHYVVA